MADNLKDLEGKTSQEITEIAKQEQARLNKLLTTREEGFGLTAPELAPVTDVEVQAAIDALNRAININTVAWLRRRQRDVLEGVKKRTAQELANAAAAEQPYRFISREKPQLDRRSAQPQRGQRSGRQTYQVDEICAGCQQKVTELPFQPTPGKPVYCQNCWQEGRGYNRGDRQERTGSVFGQELVEASARKDERIKDLEAQLAAAQATAGGGPARKQLSKRERRELRRQKRDNESE